MNLAALHRDRIDLVLTCRHGRHQWPQLVERLRNDNGSLPVLFMSGHPPDQMPTLGIDAEDDILRKPFTPSALAIAVRAVLIVLEATAGGSV